MNWLAMRLAALRQGRRPGEAAEQAGHSPAICQDTYEHVIAEFRGVAVTDPSEEVRKARVSSVRHEDRGFEPTTPRMATVGALPT
jgi:hypothetical protein